MICTGRQRLVNILDDPYDSYAESTTRNGALSSSLCEKVLSVSNDMHGSTTTREYIRRLVRMDKSALRVDTSRQYWTNLKKIVRNGVLHWNDFSCNIVSLQFGVANRLVNDSSESKAQNV